MITQIKMPAINANEEQGTLVRWLCQDGDVIRSGTAICEVETTKATVEIESDAAGFLQRLIPEGQQVTVGGLLAVIKTDANEEFVPARPAEIGRTDRKWTKKAFLVARRMGIDIEKLAADKNDVVTEDDVIRSQEAGNVAVVEVARLDPLVPPQGNFNRVLLIGGAGGAGNLALDAIARSTDQFAVGIIDNNKASHHKMKRGVPVLGGSERIPELLAAGAFDGAVVLFSEDIEERKRQYETYVAMGVPFTNLIDPSVQFRWNVQIGKGNVILPNCFIATETVIGDNNFFASHTVIEHDSKIGNHCTFGPRCTTSGRVTIGDSVKFGMSVSVEPYITIGNNAIIASGSVITANVAANSKVRAKISQSATS